MCEQVVSKQLDQLLPELREPQIQLWERPDCRGASFPAFEQDEQFPKNTKLTLDEVKLTKIGSIHIPNHMILKIKSTDGPRWTQLFPGIYDDLNLALLTWENGQRINQFDKDYVQHVEAVPMQPWREFLIQTRESEQNYEIRSYRKRFNINSTLFKEYCEEDPSRNGCQQLATLNTLKEQYPKSWPNMCLNYLMNNWNPKTQYVPVDANICDKGRRDCVNMFRTIAASKELDPIESTTCFNEQYQHEIFTDSANTTDNSNQNTIANSVQNTTTNSMQNRSQDSLPKNSASRESSSSSSSIDALTLVAFIAAGLIFFIFLYVIYASHKWTSKPQTQRSPSS